MEQVEDSWRLVNIEHYSHDFVQKNSGSGLVCIICGYSKAVSKENTRPCKKQSASCRDKSGFIPEP